MTLRESLTLTGGDQAPFPCLTTLRHEQPGSDERQCRGLFSRRRGCAATWRSSTSIILAMILHELAYSRVLNSVAKYTKPKFWPAYLRPKAPCGPEGRRQDRDRWEWEGRGSNYLDSVAPTGVRAAVFLCDVLASTFICTSSPYTVFCSSCPDSAKCSWKLYQRDWTLGENGLRHVSPFVHAYRLARLVKGERFVPFQVWVLRSLTDFVKCSMQCQELEGGGGGGVEMTDTLVHV